MDDNVFSQFVRDVEQMRVERKPPFLGDRPPFRPHRTYVNLRWLNPDPRRPMPCRPAQIIHVAPRSAMLPTILGRSAVVALGSPCRRCPCLPPAHTRCNLSRVLATSINLAGPTTGR